MGYINGTNREQAVLFPEILDDYIDKDNPVRVFDRFVDSVDMLKLGFNRVVPASEGRPGYDPRDMLKLYIYGYFNKIRSSRHLAREAGRNVELMWLINKLTPDFRTISDFRKDNKSSLKGVFKEFNRLCDEIGLYSLEYISIDGSKFKGVNAKDRNFTLRKLDDRLARLNLHIEEYLQLLDQADNAEGDEQKLSVEKILTKIEEFNKRKARYTQYRQTLEERGETQLSLTDKEARLMKFNRGFDVGYNVQTAVDSVSHLISDFVVTDHPADSGLLETVACGVKEAFGLSGIEVVADKGYRDKEDMMNCLEQGIIPNVFPEKGDIWKLQTEYEPAEIEEAQKNSNDPEDIKTCLRAGIIPEIYKDVITDIEVVSKRRFPVNEVVSSEEFLQSEELMREKASEGFFVRDKDRDLVYCPGGAVLRRKSAKKNGKVRYSNRTACKQCKHKCTSLKCKEVDFGPEKRCIASMMYEQKQRIKKQDQRISQKVKFVRLCLKVDFKKLANRKSLSEHPFGTVKRSLDSYYLLLKGKEKATGELALSFMAYNMRRAMNMTGVSNLLATIRS